MGKKTRNIIGRRKIFEGFMDSKAVETIQRLRAKGLYDEIGAPIKEGKESIILLAYKGGEARIIKVHKIETSKFERMVEYLQGDPRFSRAPVHNKRVLVYMWAKKEFANLRRALDAGVRVPEPYAYSNNVLVMQFIGEDAPAPLLKDAELEDPQKIFDDVVVQYKKLYKAGLVHADLSEYNVLIYDGPWLIDFAQAVVHAHPKSQEFFERDLNNIVTFFNRRFDLKISVEETIKRIV